MLLDIKSSSILLTLTRGKLTKLEDHDPVLLDMVNKEWTKMGQTSKLNCFVMQGENKQSNAFVTSGKLVIYDTMFEHIPKREHLMAIIRHEMGHAIKNHIPKIVVARLLYYNLLFIGMAFLVLYKEKWLPMFGITYNSVFLALFGVMHFIHFKTAYYVYNICEHTIQRQFEFDCDEFSAETGDDKGAQEIKDSLMIMFYKNKLDFYTDRLYSKFKNHHPTLQERVDALTPNSNA